MTRVEQMALLRKEIADFRVGDGIEARKDNYRRLKSLCYFEVENDDEHHWDMYRYFLNLTVLTSEVRVQFRVAVFDDFYKGTVNMRKDIISNEMTLGNATPVDTYIPERHINNVMEYLKGECDE